MRNRMMCSVISSTLLLVSFATTQAQKATTKEFVVTSKTNNASVDDLKVSFSNRFITPQSAVIKDAMGATQGTFNTKTNSPAGTGTFVYTNPLGNDGKTPINVLMGWTVTLTVQSTVTPFSMPGPNTFSSGTTQLQNSVGLLSPDIDLLQNPNTGIAAVSFGNSTDSFLFLTDVEVWTGLTAAQGNSFDANGNFITSDLPSTPNYTLADLDLSPGQPESPVLPIGVYPNDGSFVVALYDVEAGPDSNINDATNVGELAFATNDPVLTPEPPSLLLFASGVVMFVVRKCMLHRFARQGSMS